MRTVALLVALLAILPSAHASWGGGPGSREPNTPQDAQGGRMFPDAPTSGGRVYFDAFPTVDQLTLNPNSAILGSRLLPAGPTTFRAFLGEWADCNGDGYVGSYEGALQDYPSALVTDLDACPVGGPHNDGQWVSELLMIGMVDPCEFRDATYRAESCATTNYDPTTTSVPAFFQDSRVIYAPSARVWGDVGTPDQGNVHCPVAPLARGATSGTGALLREVDCQDGYAIASRVDETDPSGSFGRALDQQFPVNLFGNPTTGKTGLLERGSGDPAFTVWDCSQPKAIAAQDPNGAVEGASASDPTPDQTLTGPQVIPVVGTQTVFADEDGNPATPGVYRPLPDDAQGNALWVPAPGPALKDPTGSWWDAAEMAADGPRGDCDASTANALGQRYAGGAIEGTQEPGAPGAKARNDVAFSFYDGYRGIDSHVDPTLHSQDFPSDLGLVYMRNQYGGPIWSAEEPLVTRPALVRADDLSAEGPSWFTFYATFQLVGLRLPDASAATYGGVACTEGIGRDAPSENGWACDPGAWWRDDAGADSMPRYSDGEPLGAVPGDSFLLEDVDCYDGTLAPGIPVGVGLASLSSPGLCPQV